MSKRHKSRVKARTCVSCESCNVDNEMRKPTQRDGPKKSPQKSHYKGCALSIPDESLLCEHILTLSQKNFIFNNLGLRMFVKAYLDRLGMRVNRFKDNFPGKNWAEAFLRRHNQRLYVLSTKTDRNPVTNEMEVSRAINAGLQDELLLKAQPSTETEASSHSDRSSSTSQYSTCSSSSQKGVSSLRKVIYEKVTTYQHYCRCTYSSFC